MSYDVLTFAELSDRFSSLRQAPLGDRRAPHKPLLILLMLGRYQRGNFQSLFFEEAQVQLKELLFEFGPPSRSPNVLDPFWRLQNDGIWKVEDASGARVADTIEPPTAGTLVDRTARGNFAPEIAATLQKQPAYIPRLARELLLAHFPQSLYTDICAAVGLELDNVPHELATEQRLVREADFRPRIIRAYEYRCAVTGWDLRVGNIEVGLEAAHIKWHSAGGPSVERNGIALNSLHHKLFDLGAFTLSLGDGPPEILVSREVHGGDYARQRLIDLHGKRIRQPQDRAWFPSPEFIAWHHQEVFKGESRAV